MGYVQMTLDDWMRIKDSLREDLQGVAQSFVRIGYKLRQIEERRLYEADGYKSLTEFAKAEYGLSQSATSRFMAINAKYSIGGYGEQLRPEFAALGSSKLSEMLTLPDADLSMITPETPREAIREMKSFEKSKPVWDGVELIEALIEVNREAIREWYASGMGAEKLRDLLNPAGTRTFRKGVWFVLMYEADVKVKKFPEAPKSMTWAELADQIYEVYEPDQEAEQNVQEAEHSTGGGEHGRSEDIGDHQAESAESGGLSEQPDLEHTEEENRTEAQEDPAVVGEPEEPEADAVGVCDTGEAGETVEVEILPPPEKYAPAHKGAEKEPEIIDQEETGDRITRWQFMKRMGTADLAEYMIAQHKEKSITTLTLMSVSSMAKWLDEEVDEKGDTWREG